MSRLIKRLSLLVFVLFTASFLLAACGGGEGPADPPKRVEDEPVATEAGSDREEDEEPRPNQQPNPRKNRPLNPRKNRRQSQPQSQTCRLILPSLAAQKAVLR